MTFFFFLICIEIFLSIQFSKFYCLIVSNTYIKNIYNYKQCFLRKQLIFYLSKYGNLSVPTRPQFPSNPTRSNSTRSIPPNQSQPEYFNISKYYTQIELCHQFKTRKCKAKTTEKLLSIFGETSQTNMLLSWSIFWLLCFYILSFTRIKILLEISLEKNKMQLLRYKTYIQTLS